jgi:hypothetical protein
MLTDAAQAHLWDVNVEEATRRKNRKRASEREREREGGRERNGGDETEDDEKRSSWIAGIRKLSRRWKDRRPSRHGPDSRETIRK